MACKRRTGRLLSLTLCLLAGLLPNGTIFAIDRSAIEEVVVIGIYDTRTINVVDSMAISPDTAQLVKQAPGANVNNNGPLTGIPQYRGMYGARVAVIVDGALIAPAGPNWMDPPLSYAAAAQLESLEINRGIAPLSAAQESIGGVIRAESWDAPFNESGEAQFNAQIAATTQSVNHGSMLNVALSGTSKHHRLVLGAMTETGDDADFPGGTLLPTEYQRNRFNLAYTFNNARHQWQFRTTRNDTGPAGTPALPMDIGSIDGDLFNAGYRYSSNDFELTARLYGSDLRHSMTNYHLRAAPEDTSRWRRNTTATESFGWTLQVAINDNFGHWRLGIDSHTAEHDSFIDNPKQPTFFVRNFNQAERRIRGGFIERHVRMNEDWSTEFGIRSNRVDTDARPVDGTPAMMMPPAASLRDAFNGADRHRTDRNLDAVIKIRYEGASHSTYYLGMARKHRSPSYQERYLWLPMEATAGLADGNTYTGDTELKPETALEIEFCADFSTSNLTLSPCAFYRQVNDYIQGTPGTQPAALMMIGMLNASSGMDNPPPLQFSNVDATFRGFDMDWRYTLTRHWSLRGIVNYVRAERSDIDDNLYRIPPFNMRMAAHYQANSWGMSIDAELYASQTNVSLTNRELVTAGYGILNLSGFWQVSPDLRLATGIQNVFDRAYEDHMSAYNRAANPDIQQGHRLPGYGRNIFLRIDYTL